MNKILLIIEREYFSRVKKKSFLILTFLVPVIFYAMFALIYKISADGDNEITYVNVIDDSGIFNGKLKNSAAIQYVDLIKSFNDGKKQVLENKYDFLLYIPKDVIRTKSVEIYSNKKTGLLTVQNIKSQINELLRAKMLADAGIDAKTLESIKPNISVISKEITAEGEKNSSEVVAYGVSFASAIIIYMSLFIYGAQVMRGVIEEKTNRIIEVVISSVKPFQLMMGKIIGIAMVGLTQFILWIALSAALLTFAGTVSVKNDVKTNRTEQVENQDSQIGQQANAVGPAGIIQALETISYAQILTVFLIYYLGGFLLYSALFAAVGSAVDNDTETQQFMFPITMPLLFTYILSFSFIINHPNSSLSFWLSIIPFTSPIAMMVRLPLGVPDWQLYLSIALLIAGFIFTTWFASRIYRVGILMYGKKASYKELIKWFSYKE